LDLHAEPLIGGNASLQEYNLATQAILGFNLLREAEECSTKSGYKIVSMKLTESSLTLPFPSSNYYKDLPFRPNNYAKV
jgi:hypothetical protein